MKKKKSKTKKAARRRHAAAKADLPEAGVSSYKARNPQLDTLRGLAIVLMIVDHGADMLWGMRIQVDTIRIVTRLAMPLFCMLSGYFLYRVRWPRGERIVQVAAASVLANVVYWNIYQRLEILVSMLLAIAVCGLLRRWAPLAMAATLLAAFDPSGAILDYPLMVVLACVSAGTALRWAGEAGQSTGLVAPWRHGGVGIAAVGIAWLAMAASSVWIPRPTAFVLWFVPVAGAMLWAAATNRLIEIAPLRWIGRFPLTIYVAQYYLLWALTYVL